MRRAVLAVVLALAGLVWPAASEAQDVGPDQTIIDALIWIEPPNSADLCMQIGAGRLTVTTQVVRESASQPSVQPSFNLYGFMADPNVTVTTRITGNEATSTVQLIGTRYCWGLGIDPRFLPSSVPTMSNAERGAFVQLVHLKMVLTPQ